MASVEIDGAGGANQKGDPSRIEEPTIEHTPEEVNDYTALYVSCDSALREALGTGPDLGARAFNNLAELESISGEFIQAKISFKDARARVLGLLK